MPQLTAVGKVATKVVRKIKLQEEVSCIETAYNPFFKLYKHLDLVVDSESSELLQQLWGWGLRRLKSIQFAQLFQIQTNLNLAKKTVNRRPLALILT